MSNTILQAHINFIGFRVLVDFCLSLFFVSIGINEEIEIIAKLENGCHVASTVLDYSIIAYFFHSIIVDNCLLYQLKLVKILIVFQFFPPASFLCIQFID